MKGDLGSEQHALRPALVSVYLVGVLVGVGAETRQRAAYTLHAEWRLFRRLRAEQPRGHANLVVTRSLNSTTDHAIGTKLTPLGCRGRLVTDRAAGMES